MAIALDYTAPSVLPSDLPAPAATRPSTDPSTSNGSTYVGRMRPSGGTGTVELWADRSGQLDAGTDLMSAVAAAQKLAGQTAPLANGPTAQAILQARTGALYIAPLTARATGDDSGAETPVRLSPARDGSLPPSFAKTANSSLVAVVGAYGWVPFTSPPKA